MWHLIGAVVLNAAGIFFGISSYQIDNYTLAYVLGTVSVVAYLLGFVLLEYAMYYYDFGTVFTTWGAGMAAVMALGGIFLWGEAASMLKLAFIFLTLLGIGLLAADRSKGYS